MTTTDNKKPVIPGPGEHCWPTLIKQDPTDI